MVIQREEPKRIYLKAHDTNAKMAIYNANSTYQLGCHIGYLMTINCKCCPVSHYMKGYLCTVIQTWGI
jgi:hypothetical protein